MTSQIEVTRCDYRQSKLNEALDDILLALALAEKYDDTLSIAASYSFLTLLFNRLEQPEKGIALLPYVKNVCGSNAKFGEEDRAI